MQAKNKAFVARTGGVAVALLFSVVVACGGQAGADRGESIGPVGSASAAQSAPSFCWLDSYGRGAGAVPDLCTGGQQMDAGLCYPACAPGYYNVGPVCWQA